ncbi:MAG: hypothetical protein ACO3JL_11350, partial [Myxococcota bacterium]
MMRALRISVVTVMALALWLAAACEQSVSGACEGSGPCDAGPKADAKPEPPPRLYVDPPFGIGFDCVTLGCDETQTFVVENRGGGRLALRLIRLST